MAENTLAENIAQAISDFAAIKAAIVDSGVEVPDGTPTSQYGEKVTEVYEKGKSEGGDGTTDAWYDTFWNSYIGGRSYFENGFFGIGWNDTTFKPNQSMQVANARYMFASSYITDLKGILESLGIEMDFSNCTTAYCAFSGSKVTQLPKLDFSKVATSAATTGGFRMTFNGCSSLVWIDEIVFNENQLFSATFNGCTALEHMIVSGKIGSAFGVSASGLDYESLLSIIEALVDYSGTETTYTCTLGENNLARLTDEEKAIAVGKGWTLA